MRLIWLARNTSAMPPAPSLRSSAYLPAMMGAFIATPTGSITTRPRGNFRRERENDVFFRARARARHLGVLRGWTARPETDRRSGDRSGGRSEGRGHRRHLRPRQRARAGDAALVGVAAEEGGCRRRRRAREG